MKTSKKENRYVTQPLLDFITQSDFKRKDDLYCILDTIYRRQTYFKTTLQKQYGYLPISSTIFLNLIGKKSNVVEAVKFLVDNNLIKQNSFFVYGVSPKSYKITSEFLGNKIAVEIEDKNINERIKKIRLDQRKHRVKNLEFAKTKYYKNFKIDGEGALNASEDVAKKEIRELCNRIGYNINSAAITDLIECKNNYISNRHFILTTPNGKELNHILHRLMVHQSQINSIKDGFLFFSRNKTNGRLDSNLTSLPSYLRKFIISEEKLINLDIKNSQPYFLYTKLINDKTIDKKELEFYGKLVVEGRLYEFLLNQIESKTDKIIHSDRAVAREVMKKRLFKIFYSKTTSFTPFKDFFRELFPTIMNFIDETNFVAHNTLAILLQERESHTILDIVMVKLQEIGINAFTIHDSFIITENELEVTKEIVLSTCIEMYGIAPALHQDQLIDIKDDSEDEMYSEDLNEMSVDEFLYFISQ